MLADMRASFGSDVADKWTYYQQSSGGRAQMRSSLASFAEADLPLSRSQRQQLVDTFTSAARTGDAALRAYAAAVPPGDPRTLSMQRDLYRTDQVNAAVIAGASSYLTPEQLKILQQQQQRQTQGLRSQIEQLQRAREDGRTGP